MERRKRVEKIEGTQAQEGELLWIKLGGGSLRLKLNDRNMILKPGQKFFAKKSDLPLAFMDLLECLSDEEEIKKVEKSEQAATPKRTLRIVIAEDSEDNKSIQEQINDLEDIDFEDEDDVETLKTGLIENGHPELAKLETEKLKDSVIEKLKSQFVYDILNKKGKKLNEQPLTFAEAEKLAETLA